MMLYFTGQDLATPLYLAAENGYDIVVDNLISHGAKVNAIDKVC